MQNYRLIHLKIKLKTLAQEARYIRQEELTLKNTGKRIKACKTLSESDRNGIFERNIEGISDLHHHRTFDLRKAARHSHIAYGFLKGKAYSQIENKPKTEPLWSEVEKIVKRFGGEALAAKLKSWYTSPTAQAA